MHTRKTIKTVRTLLGLSQKELAEKLKLRVKTIQTIEGMPHHTLSAISRISQAMAIAPEMITHFEAGELIALTTRRAEEGCLSQPGSLLQKILSTGKSKAEMIGLLREHQQK